LCIGGGMLGLAAAALPGEPAPGVDAQGVVIGLIAALVGLALVFLGRRAPGVVYDVVAIAAVVGTGAQLRLVAGSEQMGTGQVIPGELILVPIVLFVGALRPIRSCVAGACCCGWASSPGSCGSAVHWSSCCGAECSRSSTNSNRRRGPIRSRVWPTAGPSTMRSPATSPPPSERGHRCR
jgi:hypothetical protein